jgi:HSP20 family protein
MAMLLRFDPFRELDRLTQQVLGAASGTLASVPMDAYRRGDEVVVSLDLPGVDPDTIEVTVEKDVLTIAGERRHEVAEDAEVLVRERPVGTFTRRLFLGESLDTEGIRASYDRGVLTVTIPVAAEAKPRRVAVERGHQAQAIEAQASPAQNGASAPSAEPVAASAA